MQNIIANHLLLSNGCLLLSAVSCLVTLVGVDLSQTLTPQADHPQEQAAERRDEFPDLRRGGGTHWLPISLDS
jgi:hypothetical protein